MCLNPITLPNNSKFLWTDSLWFFRNTFACGQCAECQLRKSSEWQYRLQEETENCFRHNGYIMVDTLTYAPKYHPRLKDFFPDVKLFQNVKVVDYKHVRLFMANLRDALGDDCKENLKFFVVSEYGSDKRYTHRVHYHIIFFVYNSFIQPLELSQIIADEWTYGRTEGLPYKGRNYVISHNTITLSPLSVFRVSSYISKYLEKDSDYYKKVISRLKYIIINEFGEFDLSKKVQKARYKELYNRVRTFHRQSLHFGESALGNIDLQEVFRDGTISLKVPQQSMVRHIPLPTYYKRKLFYNIYKFDKSYYWVENELGKLYNWTRYVSLPEKLKKRFDSYNLENPDLRLDSERLSKYLTIRFSNNKPYQRKSLLEKISPSMLFNYRSVSDLDFFKKPFINQHYIGNCKVGYDLENYHPIEVDFEPYEDPEMEKALSALDIYLQARRCDKENYYQLQRRQRKLKRKLREEYGKP